MSTRSNRGRRELTRHDDAYLVEGMRLDLRELVLHVVGIHGTDLLARGRAQDLDNLHELIDARLPGKEGLPEHELGHDASGRPHVCEGRGLPVSESRQRKDKERPALTDLGGVVRGAKDQLRGAIVARADVRHVGLVRDQDLGASKVAQLQDARGRIQEQVLRLDVAMADALRVDVGERTEKLVDVKLDLEDRHRRLQLVEVTRGTIDGLGHVFQDQVQVHLIPLFRRAPSAIGSRLLVYLLAHRS